MPIGMRCQCGFEWQLDPAFFGREVLCPSCQAVHQLPEGAVSAPASAAAPEDDILAFKEESRRAPASGGLCPRCQYPLSADAVFCTCCGLDIRTGVAVPQAKSEPRVPGVKAAPQRRASRQIIIEPSTRRLLLLGGFGVLLAGAAVWYVFSLVVHPNLGPLEITFTEQAAGQLEMHVLWQDKVLPDQPPDHASDVEELVGLWYVKLRDGRIVKPRWSPSKSKGATRQSLYVIFRVPRSSLVSLRFKPHHELTLQTPSGATQTTATLPWRERLPM